MKYHRVIVALLVITLAILVSIHSTHVDHAKRGIICNTQDYDPMTAKQDIEMCRLGLYK